ncbi:MULTISPECIES: C39 family peptidase [unclassified Bacillus (in: firmicutes)]|uniref:C39 family peptidase n=1 Tax=unclassified Bacillus (in: firmicutes) TaxID=185979 RepID=UPI001BEC69A6|nr:MULTISPECIES: C39 family peptidase [unclassified Bacillus (in: firmicutes)]MBT2640261.1 C39 family peptidase [Bacillus sp. ISL-39]MBT2662669.1 C39 family peptidase [Bacillus sp. ISL-45]
MNKKLLIRTLSIGGIFLATYLGAENLRSIKNPTAETQAAVAPKITRTEAHSITKTIEDKKIFGDFFSTEEKEMIEGVPHISQLPELQRGCEVTSLTMLLQYEGIAADKMNLAEQIHKIPFRDTSYVRSNPYDGFVGDIYTFSKSGYGVYHRPVAKLAENYLPGKVKDITGQSVNSVYELIDTGSPVWVITNSSFAPLPESEFTVWETNTGNVKITYKEHSVLIVGYDEEYIYINDPLASEGYKAVPRTPFENAWVQMGSQAIGIEK